ncbi:MAG: aminodeoxychorismate synthase component I [Bacteroidia bacterium]|nr:aminodeoxychorismate synthase component I [Bacteroidia bacterium]NND09619.1 aminodeoxychorismate synthase component I [Flavobacteriaceae bacterium]NNK27803.1 aminodeoxychorismate synthase component I [Flavobacteriaceae bacterium]RZV67138.1 MAG: aminodeoxychorismate synthase component I [Flavobacteriaceae bacterium]
MRVSRTYHIDDTGVFKDKLLFWAHQFNEVAWLDSNDFPQKYSSYDVLLAVDAFTSLRTDYHSAFDDLNAFQSNIKDWLFGYLSYDLKNAVEDLESNNYDGLEFPDLYFFQPKKVFLLKDNQLEVQYLNMVDNEIDTDFKAIHDSIPIKGHQASEPIKIKLRIHKDEYFEKVDRMLAHIQRGDIYEANFCQEFYAEDSQIDPLQTYWHLNDISKAPFACYLKLGKEFLLSASPERYLKKEGNTIISQPIKGTAKRMKNGMADSAIARKLSQDEKERSENIMIVDLVRNDLSKTAKKGTVKVSELCKVYSFEQVHQMISTVTSEVEDSLNPVEVLHTTYPMGSMTGAPKISAMKIIEELEETKRGLYSGAVGYFTPEGDFDFNVVIRSILYNSSKQYISYSVGGAITAKSNPQKEYEECLLKAKAMREVLE